MVKKNPVKVGLALGGGGVRGLAHLGVIQELAQDMPIDMISGTSMGAIVAAVYALNPDIKAAEQKLFEVLNRKEIKEIERMVGGHTPAEEKKLIIQTLLNFFKKMYLFNLRAIKRWVFGGREISAIFDHLGLDKDFKQAKIPFCCVSVDLRTGEEVVISEGNIKQAVLASVSLPGVFPPVKRGKQLLVDGGIITSVPVNAARAMGADVVIGVGVEAQVDYNKRLGNGLDIMFQADAIRAAVLAEIRLEAADIVIRPEVGRMSWAEFARSRECVQAGVRAARKHKPEILDLVRSKSRQLFWRRLFSG